MKIKAYAFQQTGLCELKLGKGIAEIPFYGFSETSLESVTIPESVLEIEEGACWNIKGKASISPFLLFTMQNRDAIIASLFA